MSNYIFNTLVSKQEQEALKEMIFQRAKARAEALTENAQASYTTSMKNDIMDLARVSFTANKNPFSIETEKKLDITQKPIENNELEISKKQVNELKDRIYKQQNIRKIEIQESLSNQNMEEALNGLKKRKNFTGALEFLNSQASMDLMKLKHKNFDKLA